MESGKSDMRAGNKRLAAPSTLNLTVFKECPILGCYLLTCADTSAVANMFTLPTSVCRGGWTRSN